MNVGGVAFDRLGVGASSNVLAVVRLLNKLLPVQLCNPFDHVLVRMGGQLLPTPEVACVDEGQPGSRPVRNAVLRVPPHRGW